MSTSLLFSLLMGNAALGVEKLTGAAWNILPYVVLVMLMDYIMGLIIAFLQKSPKSETHGISSNAAFRGLVKKFVILILISCGYIVDRTLNLDYIGKMTALSFLTSELISILENAVILGVSKPKALVNALEVMLNTKVSLNVDNKNSDKLMQEEISRIRNMQQQLEYDDLIDDDYL